MSVVYAPPRYADGLNDGAVLAGDVTQTAGQILLRDGTAGAPPLAFANEPDCGLYLRGANEVAVAANGTAIHAWGGNGQSTLSGALVISGGDLTMDTGRALQLDTATTVGDLPLQFLGDPNTGLRRSAADTLSFVTGGSEYALIGGGGITVTQIVNTGALYQREMVAPAGVTDYAVIYAVVDGGAKTDLAARFQSGAAVVFAQEP